MRWVTATLIVLTLAPVVGGAAPAESVCEKHRYDPRRDREGAAFAVSTDRFLSSAALKSASHIPSNRADDRRAAPLPRPRPISVAQFQALQQVGGLPEHARVPAQRAAYSPEAARQWTEVGVTATQVGIPASMLIALIAAAPL